MLQAATQADTAAPNGDDAFSPRQTAVLEVALALLVEVGDKGFTTAALARAANCSKESLYRWFGDRNGLIAAMITYQASKVRVSGKPATQPSAAEFRSQLTGFAADLLAVLSGPTSLALNRLSIGEAGREGAKFGKLLIERGRRAIEQRAMRMIEAGRKAGLICFDNRDEAFNALYGLVVGDMHVRMLLGDSVPLITGPDAIARHSERAVDQFLRLYGMPEQTTTNNT